MAVRSGAITVVHQPPNRLRARKNTRVFCLRLLCWFWKLVLSHGTDWACVHTCHSTSALAGYASADAPSAGETLAVFESCMYVEVYVCMCVQIGRACTHAPALQHLQAMPQQMLQVLGKP